jgi:hypothetical protein
MRYLRMLSNSVIAGGLGAAYLGVLILQLNPSVPLDLQNVGWLLRTLALSYGVNLVAFFYGLIVLRQLFASEVISPGWTSFSMLSWLFTLTAATASWLTWMNLRTFSPMLEPDTVRRMTTGAASLTVCALVFLALALVPYSFGRRGRRIGASLFALTVVASFALPLYARGPGVPRTIRSRSLAPALGRLTTKPAPRVLMILIDGASLDYISAAAAEGRLPNFGKILDGGAAMHLATLRPTQPATVWTAVATGKLPSKNGVRSAATYGFREGLTPIELLPDFCFCHALVRFGFLTESPHESDAVRVRPLWTILSSLGVPVGVVGWPLTYPVQRVRGYLVSDHFHRARVAALDMDDADVVYPPELLQVARNAAEPKAGPGGGPQVSRSTLPEGQDLSEGGAIELDHLYEQVAAAMEARDPASFRALRLRAIDTIGHYFLRYAMPGEFGDVTEEERRRYGNVLNNAYGTADLTVGRAMASLAQGDLLLVVSGFGMEPLSPGKRILERLLGNNELTGSHERAPDGFLLAYGSAVEPGRRPRASVLDVAPTVLYFFGLPVARDMDGYARTDIFRRSLTGERPITFIPSYEQ